MRSVHLGRSMRPPFVRRYAVQIAAVTVAVVGVVVLAVLAFRPSGGGGGTAVVKSPVTARGTATPDPRVDEVKAVARRYLQAFWDSAKTGDTSAVDALTEKDSQAYGNADLAALISKSEHHNFVAQRIDINESAWRVELTLAHATVDVTFRLYGHDADWPSLRAREPDHETTGYVSKLELAMAGGQWLIYHSS
jgi:hypothetical protein